MRIGIPLIREGGDITLYIPSLLGFGGLESDLVPANSNLVYRVQVQDSDSVFRAQTDSIDSFLAVDSILAEVHESGVRFVIDEIGNGESPTIDNLIEVTFEGRFLDGEVFDSSNSVNFSLSQLIPAWQETVPLINEGGSITIYVPSRLGFGPVGSPTNVSRDDRVIAPNSITVFDIELLSIVN